MFDTKGETVGAIRFSGRIALWRVVVSAVRVLTASVGMAVMAAACLAQTAHLPAAITALTYSPDGKFLAVGLYGEVALFDTATWKPGATFTDVEDSVRALAYSPDGKILAVGSGIPGQDGDLKFWDPLSSTSPIPFPPQKDTIEAIAFYKDGKSLLVGGTDNKVHYYAHLPYRYGPTLDEHNGRVLACAFSSKPNYIFATGAMDKIVKVWDAKTHQTVINFDQAEGGITGLAFLPSGDQIVGSSLDGRLWWWQVNYDQRRKTYSGSAYRALGAHTGGVWAMSLSADGKRIITGGQDHLTIVWKADDGARLRVFKESTQPVYAVALSPDGKIAVSGGQDGILRIWDVEANKLVTTITPPAAGSSVSFSAK